MKEIRSNFVVRPAKYGPGDKPRIWVIQDVLIEEHGVFLARPTARSNEFALYTVLHIPSGCPMGLPYYALWSSEEEATQFLESLEVRQ
jgi:hypothetical protein